MFILQLFDKNNIFRIFKTWLFRLQIISSKLSYMEVFTFYFECGGVSLATVLKLICRMRTPQQQQKMKLRIFPRFRGLALITEKIKVVFFVVLKEIENNITFKFIKGHFQTISFLCIWNYLNYWTELIIICFTQHNPVSYYLQVYHTNNRLNRLKK